jgi:hypothetical protein
MHLCQVAIAVATVVPAPSSNATLHARTQMPRLAAAAISHKAERELRAGQDCHQQLPLQYHIHPQDHLKTTAAVQLVMAHSEPSTAPRLSRHMERSCSLNDVRPEQHDCLADTAAAAMPCAAALYSTTGCLDTCSAAVQLDSTRI